MTVTSLLLQREVTTGLYTRRHFRPDQGEVWPNPGWLRKRHTKTSGRRRKTRCDVTMEKSPKLVMRVEQDLDK